MNHLCSWVLTNMCCCRHMRCKVHSWPRKQQFSVFLEPLITSHYVHQLILPVLRKCKYSSFFWLKSISRPGWPKVQSFNSICRGKCKMIKCCRTVTKLTLYWDCLVKNRLLFYQRARCKVVKETWTQSTLCVTGNHDLNSRVLEYSIFF